MDIPGGGIHLDNPTDLTQQQLAHVTVAVRCDWPMTSSRTIPAEALRGSRFSPVGYLAGAGAAPGALPPDCCLITS